MPGAPAETFTYPTFGWAPPAVSSFGGEAVELAASAGLYLDGWQAYVLDQILAEQEDGSPAAFEAAVIVPRQNGKGSILEALSLAWLFLTEAPLILHSAHEFKTAADAFRRLRVLISHQRAPHLARRVARVTTAAGNEAIELTSGQRLRYVARSEGSGRGFTGGKLILDEAYAIKAEEMAAMLPTLATQAEAQLVYTSSAGMAASTHLQSLRDRGRAGNDPSLCWLEWGGQVECPEGCRHALDDDTCQLNDRGVWAAANPSWEIRRPDGSRGITEAYVAKERRSLSAIPDKFARERCGVWDAALTDASPISAAAWQACADPEGRIDGPPVLFVDVSPDRRSAAIALAGRRVDGAAQVELVRHASGEGWVLGELERARSAGIHLIGVDGKSPAAVLVSDLERLRFQVVTLTAPDMADACGGLQRDVAADPPAVRHLGDPAIELALALAARRPLGDGGWAWARKRSDGDITPLVAVTGARHVLVEHGSGDPLDNIW